MSQELKTLSEIIKQRRVELGLSCRELASVLKISSRYLNYLENNELQKMPAAIYTKGFLCKYSKILGLDSKRIIVLYERETGSFKNEKSGKKPARSVFAPKIAISSKTIATTIVALAILLVGAYWWKQVSSFFVKPSLQVMSPANDLTVDKNNIEIEGKTDSGNEVTINDQKIAVGDDGTFNEKILLKDGLNIFTITAKDSYGKEGVVLRKIVLSENNKDIGNENYQKTIGQNKLTAEAKDSIINNLATADNVGGGFRIKTKTTASWVKISSGGEVIYSGILLPGIIKSFDIGAEREIKITASSPDAVLVSLNNQEFKTISDKNKVLLENSTPLPNNMLKHENHNPII